MTDTISSIADALPDYDVQRELGRGAMGVVYLGRHRRLDRVVAIKEIAGPLADDPEVRARFLTEARVLAALDHPHIVPVYDYVEGDGRCLLIMEALGGGTVWDHFQRDGLSLATSCALLLSTCSAVEHAHRNGVLHRDLKPENLLLSTTGQLKVTDFGIAKVLDGGHTLATVDGSVLGTPAYMAPEQAEGGEVGPATDVYALGVMLFEMLSGRLPHEATTPMALLVARITTDPPPLATIAPGVPAAICAVVDRAIARSVDDRIQSAAELARELRGAADGALDAGWFDDLGPALPPASAAPEASTAPRSSASSTIAPAGTTSPADGSRDVAATIMPTGTPPPAGAPRDVAATIMPTGSPAPADVPATPPAAQTIVPSAQPVTTDGSPVAEPASSPPAAAVVRPSATAHLAGFDANLRRDDLVAIGDVVRPQVPIRVPLIVTAVLIVAAVVLMLIAPNEPIASGEGRDALSLDGQTVTDDEPVVVDPTAPFTITGLPTDTSEITFELVTAGLPLASATAPVTDGTAEVDIGVRGWLAGGVGEAHLDLVTATGEVGATSADATPIVVIVDTERPWWQSGLGVATILFGLFGLAAAESQSRRHRRGRVRTSAAAAAAVGAGLALACATVILTLATDRVVTLGGWLIPAAVGAAAGIALTVTRARVARHRRIRWRDASR